MDELREITDDLTWASRQEEEAEEEAEELLEDCTFRTLQRYMPVEAICYDSDDTEFWFRQQVFNINN